jgi:molybdopterin-containing oxidoreductase family iron-sulfur binding subunit
MLPLYKGFNDVQSVTLEKADGDHEFVCVQGQKTLMGRGDIIKETTLRYLILRMLRFGTKFQWYL